MKQATTYKLAMFQKRGPRILIYGAPKTGKTCFALGFPRPTIVDYDGRMDETVMLARAAGVDPESVHIMVQPTYLEVIQLLEAAKTWGPDRTLVFDGLSSWSEYELREILYGGKTRSKRDGAPGLETYSQRASHQGDILLSLQLLKCNIVVIAHEELVREYEDVIELNERLPGGRILRVPFVPGRNMGAMIGKYFDFVLYAQKSGTKLRPKFEVVSDASGEIRCGGTLPLFAPTETMTSLSVRVGNTKRLIPAFDAYRMFQARLEDFNQEVEVSEVTEENETEEQGE